MPCIVCGAATKENSLICDSCLQKEIKQGGKGASQGDSRLKKASQIPSSSEKKPADTELSTILDNLGDSLNVSDDIEITSKPNTSEVKTKPVPIKPAQKVPPTSESDISLDLDNLFESPNSTKTQTPASKAANNHTLNIDDSMEFDGELSLDLDKPAEPLTQKQSPKIGFEEHLKTGKIPSAAAKPDEVPLDLDGSSTSPDVPHEDNPEAEIVNIVGSKDGKVESDEDILKKKIKNRLQLKIQKTEPGEKETETVDDIIDEVLLDEIEDIKKEAKPKASAEPIPKKEPEKKAVENILFKKTPVPEPDLSKSSESEKENDFLEDLLKPKETEKSRQEFHFGNKPISAPVESAADKKEEKSQPQFESKNEDRFKSSDKIIRGTTSAKSKSFREKEKKSSKTFFMIVFILIILGGGYGVYEFYLKKDPVKEKMISVILQAQEAEKAGDYDMAVMLYQSLTAEKYATYKEIATVPAELDRLQVLLDKKAELAKHQEEINNLLNRADVLFKKDRWMGKGRNALTIYREILKLDPDNTTAINRIEEMKLAYMNRGNENVKQKRFKTAQGYFENVLTIEPGNATATSSLDMVNSMIEQQSLQSQEAKKRQQELLEEQKKSESQLARKQKELDAEKNKEEERKRLEIQQAEQARLESEQQEAQKSEIVIEGLVDGNRRVYVKTVTPEVPTAAIQSNITGTVFIEVIVDNEGVPEEVKVTKSDNDILSQAAVEAIKQYRYKAPTKNGNPCKMRLTERIVFK